MLQKGFQNQKKFCKIERQKIKRFIKNTQYDWLINYIPEPTRKTVRGFKDKVVSQLTHLKIMVNKPCMGEERNQVNQKDKINLKKT